MALLDVEVGFWSIRRQMEALIGPRLTNSVLQQAGANGGASFAKSFGTAKDDEEQKGVFDSCLQAYQAAGFGQFKIKKMDWPIGHVIIRANDAFEAWMVNQHDQKVNSSVCAYTAGVLVGFVNVISDRRDVVCIEHHCQAMGDAYCEFELLPASEADKHTVVAFTPDPKLGRQLNMLEMLFERMPMGIAIFDREYHIQRYNATWGDFSVQYAPPSAAPLIPGIYYFDHLPGSESLAIPLFERVLAGETIRQNALQFMSGGITSYWDVVLAPLVENGEVKGILNVTIDATEHVLLRQNLEQRVAERTLELKTLLDVTAAANSSLDLDEMLITTLDLLVNLIDASRVGVLLRTETTGKLEAVLLRPEQIVSPKELAQIMAACEAVAASGEPLYVMPDDKKGFTEPGALLPLQIHGRILGVLVIIGSEGGRFGPEQQALFKSIADQLGVAVENAHLYGQAEQVAIATERSRLARDLHDAVTQTLFSTSLIAEVLPDIWEKDPVEGKRLLKKVGQLSRGALTEMRTLLLELRPAALAEAKLGVLLQQLAEVASGRTGVPITVAEEGECEIPTDVHITIYRVVQEALNNIVKHSSASQAAINLRCSKASMNDDTSIVELHIDDDGHGFDPVCVSPDQMGLRIMRERIEAIGAELEIKSKPGSGTRITVVWKEDKR